MKQKNSTSQNQQLSSTLKELENALNKWDEISSSPCVSDSDSSTTNEKSIEQSKKAAHALKDSALIIETKKLLTRLKKQLADLD